MKQLIKRHYDATVRRELISDSTTLDEFRDKLREEIQEFWDADIWGNHINTEMAQEAIDVVVCIIS